MVKAIYKNGVLKPLRKLDLKEGEEVEIEIKRGIVKGMYGKLKIKEDVIDEIISNEELYEPEEI